MPETIRDVLIAYRKAVPLYDLMNRLYFFGRDKRFRLALVERLNLEPDNVVLNLCCGTGLDFPYLLQKIEDPGKLLGVDLSSEMLQQAKRKFGSKCINMVMSDAAHLPFRDQTLDAILVPFCLKLVPAYEESIKETARVLKPAGRIGVLANNKPSGTLRLPGIMLTKVIGAMAKVDFEIDLYEPFFKRFVIVEDREMYGGLVRFLVGENKHA